MSKYLNKKITIDGIAFDSKKEGRCYMDLVEREKRGEISDLERQVRYQIVPAVTTEVIEHKKTKDVVKTRTIQRPSFYVADFVYTDNTTGKTKVVDVKSEITRRNPVYRLKKKMMLAFLGINIIEM